MSSLFHLHHALQASRLLEGHLPFVGILNAKDKEQRFNVRRGMQRMYRAPPLGALVPQPIDQADTYIRDTRRVEPLTE